jgi:hypothetical protein
LSRRFEGTPALGRPGKGDRQVAPTPPTGGCLLAETMINAGIFHKPLRVNPIMKYTFHAARNILTYLYYKKLDYFNLRQIGKIDSFYLPCDFFIDMFSFIHLTSLSTVVQLVPLPTQFISQSILRRAYVLEIQANVGK